MEYQFQLKPTELLLFPDQQQQIYFKSCADHQIQINVSLCAKKYVECEKAIDSLESFILDQSRIVLDPGQIKLITTKFIPEQKQQGYYPAKIILECENNSYQIPLLGIATNIKVQAEADGITNTSDEKVFFIEQSTQKTFVLLPHEHKVLQSAYRLIYGSFFVKELTTRFNDFYKSLKMKTDPVDVLAERLQFLDFTVPPNNLPGPFEQTSSSQCNTFPSVSNIPVNATSFQNQQNITIPVQPTIFPCDLHTTTQSHDYSGNLTYTQRTIDTTIDGASSVARGTGCDSQYIGTTRTQFSEPSGYIPEGCPRDLAKQYQKELQEYRDLQKELEKTQATRPHSNLQQSQYGLNDYSSTQLAYERHFVPELLPIRIKQIEAPNLFRGSDQTCLQNIPYSGQQIPKCAPGSRNNFWRVYQDELQLNGVKTIQKVGPARICILQGQLTIENQADCRQFNETVTQRVQNDLTRSHYHERVSVAQNQVYTEQVLRTLANLKNMFYQLEFVSTSAEISDFKLSVQTDTPLVNKLQPGEQQTITFSIGVACSAVDSYRLPIIFQTNQQQLYLRVSCIRFDKKCSADDANYLPIFSYEHKQNYEYLDTVDIPVRINPQFLITNEIESCFKFDELNFVQLCPNFEQNQSLVVDLGEVKLHEEKSVPKVVKMKQELQGQNKYPRTPQSNRIMVDTSRNSMDPHQLNPNAQKISQIPIFSSHTSLDYSSLKVNQIRFNVRAITLPNIPEFGRIQAEMPQMSFPIVSKIFDLRYQGRHGSHNVLNVNELFQQQRFQVGVLLAEVNIPHQLQQRLIKVFQSEPSIRLPLRIEQQFQFTIESDSGLQWSRAITLVAKLSTESSLAVHNKTTQIDHVKNSLSQRPLNINGFNLRSIVGDPNQIFVVQSVVDFGLVYIGNKKQIPLRIINGSGITIVVQVSEVCKPFKTSTSLCVKPYSQQLLDIAFQSPTPSKFSQVFRICWSDIDDVQNKLQRDGKKARNCYLEVELRAEAISCPLYIKNALSQQPHELQSGLVYTLANISGQNVHYKVIGQQCSPQEGTVEPNSESEVLFLKVKQKARVSIQWESMGVDGWLFDGFIV